VNGTFFRGLFYDEPAGTFAEGRVFRSMPDLSSAQQNPEMGYWHCDIADHDRLTWSDKVYDLFGAPPGAPVEREWAVARYADHSKAALERVRTLGINRDFSFILDAEIIPEGASARWIRVLAVPILADGRVVGLHGVKRALSAPISIGVVQPGVE
jgi:PAS domain-containing protein